MNNSIIKEIGRSYIVSSFLPAALFVSLAFLIFNKIIPTSAIDNIVRNSIFGENSWILLIIFTFWLAFALYSGVDWTVKVFEGYFFPGPIADFLREIGARKLEEKTKNINAFRNELAKGQELLEPEQIEQRWLRRNLAYADMQSLELRTPMNKENLLPTDLGNIFRASEMYPLERYRFEGITIWPKLHKIMPEQILHELEEKNNQLMFMLNSSLLLFMLGISGIVVSIAMSLLTFLELAQNDPTLSNFDFILFESLKSLLNINYLLTGVTFLIFGYIIYRIGTYVAEDFGVIVRSGYDLYRLDLLKQLNHPIPLSLQDERDIWRRLTEFFIAGGRLGLKFDDFEYSLKEELGTRNK